MYVVRLQGPAEKFLKKLDKNLQSRIMARLLSLEDNPRLGVPLTANLAGLWKLRIGDYRAIYEIRDKELIVFVLRLGHRKNVYE
jgi:mRNA interferase RelE/StbE